jgi:hypothetical protein
MQTPYFLLVLAMTACFCLSTHLHAWYLNWAGNRSGQSNLLGVLMGDSRRMFANHFFVKADAYFHSGYYPTIFDNREAFETAHMATDSGVTEEHNTGEEENFLGRPRDWIDRVNRHMFPSHHTHLDQGGAKGTGSNGLEREILPWLKISVELDPQRVETYVVASFWLSERLGKVNEAEQFLRDGLRANPESYEILLELGRLYFVHRKETGRARNIWELGLLRWRQQEERKQTPDYFSLNRFATYLARLEEQEGNLEASLHYLEMAQAHSPDPKLIEARMNELKSKLSKH